MAKTYSQIIQEIASLQEQAEQLRSKEIDGVINQIKRLIAEYQLTGEDLGFPSEANKAFRDPKRRQPKIKFKDKQGNTWAGRGPRPRWVRDALAAGKSLDDFLITGDN